MTTIKTIEPKIDLPLNLSWPMIRRIAVLAYMCDCSFNQMVEAAVFGAVIPSFPKQDTTNEPQKSL